MEGRDAAIQAIHAADRQVFIGLFRIEAIAAQ